MRLEIEYDSSTMLYQILEEINKLNSHKGIETIKIFK